MSESKYEGISKKTQLIKQQSKSLRKLADEQQCLCCHQKKGSPSLQRKNGNIFICRECEKDNISLSQDLLNKPELEKSIEHVDQVIDIIKINLRVDNEGDREILKHCAKAQNFVRNRLMDLVDSLKKRNNSDKKKKGDGDSGWGKSRTV